MKKQIIFLLILLAGTSLFAQDRFISRNGHVWFYSKTPLEVIEAHNHQTASVIDAKKGAIAFDILIKAFKFDRALMEEHFNENYMESDKYPKSTFSGKFTGFDNGNFYKNGSYNAVVEGDLTIHGVKKHIKENGTVDVKDGKIHVKAKFKIKPEDYNIQIPGLVRDKISSNLEITVDVNYSPYK